MERRALLAIVLSVAVLLIWQALFPPPAPPPSAPEPAAPTAPPAASPGAPRPPEGLGAVPRPAAAPAGPGPVAQVTTPLFEAAFGADGAVTRWVLRYRGSKTLVLGAPIGPLAVGLLRPGQPPTLMSFAPRAGRLELSADRPEGTLAFGAVGPDGLRVEKTLGFRADSYRVEIQIRAEGRQAGPPGTLALYWTTPVTLPGDKPDAPWVTVGEAPAGRHLLGRILLAQDGALRVFEAPPPAIQDAKDAPGGRELKDPQLLPVAVATPRRGWVALESDYFIAALFAGEDTRLLHGRERDLAEVGLVFPEVRVESGRSWEARAVLYVGPKEWHRLVALGVGLEQAQARNYGDFLWLPWLPMWLFCVPLLWLMNFFGTHIPGQNYGVAIILLTVLVKIVFYPLTQKSMTSMKRMQALQPQVNALRAKHKADPQRFQREQMELFRKHKVNPMGGCLPMVVQVPIFYALYLTLQYSVELQGAPFLLWITDLSKKDPYYVLPILMGVSMLVQQMMTPTVGDPRQARVMLIMPVIFTVMFLEFPTGLVLYWLVNNVLSIGQQYLIDRAARRAKPLALAEAKGGKETRKA